MDTVAATNPIIAGRKRCRWRDFICLKINKVWISDFDVFFQCNIFTFLGVLLFKRKKYDFPRDKKIFSKRMFQILSIFTWHYSLREEWQSAENNHFTHLHLIKILAVHEMMPHFFGEKLIMPYSPAHYILSLYTNECNYFVCPPNNLTYVSETIPSAISHTCTNRRVNVRIHRRLCPGKCSQVLWWIWTFELWLPQPRK